MDGNDTPDTQDLVSESDATSQNEAPPVGFVKSKVQKVSVCISNQ